MNTHSNNSVTVVLANTQFLPHGLKQMRMIVGKQQKKKQSQLLRFRLGLGLGPLLAMRALGTLGSGRVFAVMLGLL